MGFLGFRWLVNFGLLALPIGVTLGILIGLEASRSANGDPPLFTNPDVPVPKPNNGITALVSCDKAMGLHPESKGQEYTLNPNQWGWTEGEDGLLCMNVTTFNNQTYATDYSAPEFYVTWRYPQGPATQPVHAFPNIKVDGSTLPMEISKVSQIKVDVEWSYGVGNYTTDGAAATKTDKTALVDENLTNTNVAIDMFLDDDKDAAKDSTKAEYEVMVWLATFGLATQPIGYEAGTGVLATETVNGTTFSLYAGQNSLKQYVLTWVAPNTEHFVGDLTPLVKKLTDSTITKTGVKFPTTATYLGYMGLGSEALSAKEVVTFRVPTLSIDIKGSS
ncbi:xyloglucan-specific endoglucanase [Colletotrichum plurivorum]|uniref:Xyloglucan-specific endoglucanase n=2 Tax=Colletotrichum orchidearum species complex TaxID=2707337 RepID=A0A8H6JNF5_9PEZI|nr:xyloglucan-specific endoglucanase [Colletotrichum sojae]KAF6815916.1 xyloglucan-specific endoglucanase [Colletotrichum plurivorum]